MIPLAFEFERESLQMAFDSIKERKLRSALTILGIVIGIAAIIALVSIGQGTNAAVTSALGSLGGNTIFVTSGGGGGGGGFSAPTSGTNLDKKDLTTIRAVNGVDLAIGLLFRSEPVVFKSVTKHFTFYGIDTKDAQSFFKDLGVIQVDQGRFFKSGEKGVVVIGSSVASKGFSNPLKVNDKITVSGIKFQIVGIIKATGSSQYDSSVIIPIDDLNALSGTTTGSTEYTIIFARVTFVERIDTIAAAIQKKMDDLHGKGSFVVFTPTQLAQQIGTVTNTLSVVLGGIAGIALVVAGIGIANTMFMSIVERTREIGIMKAIGATNMNIIEIFLMEAALIGLIGGIVGDILGVIFSQGLGIILTTYGLTFTTQVTPELLLIGLSFSLAVGVLFGFIPARKGAKMNPIEALRYE